MSLSIENNKSIAVLPFVNMSSSEDAEYFSDGITEEIINALAKIKELKVTSRTSSFYFKGMSLPIVEIGEKLNVSTILEGSVRLSANTIRITAQLIDAKEDFHFWSETFDRSLENIFAIQDEISVLIADKLRENVGHFNLDEHLVDDFNISIEVYKKYLKGRYFIMKLDLPNTLKGIDILKEVINEEPQYPLPYLDINQGYAYLGTMGLIPSLDGFLKAKPFLDKAIELGENLPQTQLNLAWISYWQNKELDKAYSYLNNALSIQPSDEMYLTMANFLTIEGKLDLAMKYIDRALELAPFSSINVYYKGFLFYMQEKYDEAIPFFIRSLEIQPELPFTIIPLGVSYLLKGEHEKGMNYFRDLPGNEWTDLTKLSGITIAHSIIGDISNAEKGLTKIKGFLKTESAGSASHFLIHCLAQLKRTEDALNYIQKGLEYRFPLIPLLATEPLAKPLHKLSKFKELMTLAIGDREKPEAVRKYKKSLLGKSELDKFREQLDKLMEDENVFLDPNLSLRSLAEKMSLPTNYMSQLLNEGYEKNFSEYINSYRLGAFKGKIEDPKLQHLTILGLAYESGFNSKTVFNTFFKKKMGMTPKAYSKELNS